MEIIKFVKKENDTISRWRVRIIWKKNIFGRKIKSEDSDDKKYYKVIGNFHYKYRGPAISIFKYKYSIAKEIPVYFQNVSNYDWHFVIKDLAKEFTKIINLSRSKK